MRLSFAQASALKNSVVDDYRHVRAWDSSTGRPHWQAPGALHYVLSDPPQTSYEFSPGCGRRPLIAAASNTAVARIERSAKELRAFRHGNACPATGRRAGACPDWAVDHVEPLCSGGEDKAANMQWISGPDHRFKTLVDVRECRKLRRLATTPAR